MALSTSENHWTSTLSTSGGPVARPSEREAMAELPDVGEIEEMLAVIETRDPVATSVEQYDRDHGVLLDNQAEVAEAVMRELPEKYPHTRDQLQALLGRIQDVIVDNRARREDAYARGQS